MRSSTPSISTSSSSSMFRFSRATRSSFIASSKKLLSTSLMFSASTTDCSKLKICSALFHASKILSFLLRRFFSSISSSNSPIFGLTLSILLISKEANSFSSSTFFSSSIIFFSSREIWLNSPNLSLNSLKISLNLASFFACKLSSKFKNLSFSNSFISFADRYFTCSLAMLARFFLETACEFIKYRVVLSRNSLKVFISSLSRPNSSRSNLCETSASISFASLSFSPKTAIIEPIRTDLPAPLTPVKTLSPRPKFNSTFSKLKFCFIKIRSIIITPMQLFF